MEHHWDRYTDTEVPPGGAFSEKTAYQFVETIHMSANGGTLKLCVELQASVTGKASVKDHSLAVGLFSSIRN